MLEAFESDGLWLKGNLHTHTTNSDGQQTPEERVAGFKEKGYDFLALTDHGRVTRVEGNGIVLIAGVEFGVNGYHLLVLNVPDDFHLSEGASIQTAVDEVRAGGGLPILAHPYWLGLTLHDLRSITGSLGIEIYNSTCGRIGKAVSTVHWDDLLADGWRGFGFAVDDAHILQDAYLGWIMVKSQARDAASILEAIEAGRFYASTGPEIKSVTNTGGKLHVTCSDAAIINFICRRWTGCQVKADEGSKLNEAEFQLNARQGYVRIEVIDARGRTAWTNPLYIDQEQTDGAS